MLDLRRSSSTVIAFLRHIIHLNAFLRHFDCKAVYLGVCVISVRFLYCGGKLVQISEEATYNYFDFLSRQAKKVAVSSREPTLEIQKIAPHL